MQTFKSIRFYIYVILILFFGCAPISKQTINRIPQLNVVNILDLTKYTEQGFLITPESLTGNYDSIGQLYIKLLPESKREFVSSGYNLTESEKKRGISRETTNADMSPKYKWVSEKISIEKAIDQAYETAIEMGGNAIMEFSIKSITVGKIVNESEHVELNGIEVTGFIIHKND